MTTAPEAIDLTAINRAVKNEAPLPNLGDHEKRYVAQLLTEDGVCARVIAERLGVATRTVVRWRRREPIPVPAADGNTAGWARNALCREYDAALFFPADDDAEPGGRPLVSYAEARAVCARCPVRPLCLQDALDREGNTDSRHRAGMWGGLSPNQRAATAAIRTKGATA